MALCAALALSACSTVGNPQTVSAPSPVALQLTVSTATAGYLAYGVKPDKRQATAAKLTLAARAVRTLASDTPPTAAQIRDIVRSAVPDDPFLAQLAYNAGLLFVAEWPRLRDRGVKLPAALAAVAQGMEDGAAFYTPGDPLAWTPR